MRINKHIYLKDVMLVPVFTQNVLYVAQLFKDPSAKCTFLPRHCIIQGQEAEEILGIGKALGNLHVIEAVVKNHYCNLFDPKEMTLEKCHVFLGHPFITTLKHMFSWYFT